MPEPVFVAGNMTPEEAQNFRDNLALLIQGEIARGRRFTVGTLVGNVRTKAYPENAIAGQFQRIIFVCDVRLREFPGQPLARDVYVTNAAHQLITGRQSEGTPVTVQIQSSGTLTVTGRAALQTDVLAVDYYSLEELDDQPMEYVYGLRLRNTDDLATSLLADINSWRLDQGFAPLGLNEDYFYDPSGDVHGIDYYAAYIKRTQGGRFPGSIFGIECTNIRQPVSWTVAGFWNDTPTGFPAGDSAWDAEEEVTVCEVPSPA